MTESHHPLKNPKSIDGIIQEPTSLNPKLERPNTSPNATSSSPATSKDRKTDNSPTDRLKPKPKPEINNQKTLCYIALILSLVSAFIMIIATWIVNSTTQLNFQTQLSEALVQLRNLQSNKLWFNAVCSIINLLAIISALTALLRAEVKKLAILSILVSAILPIGVFLICQLITMSILAI